MYRRSFIIFKGPLHIKPFVAIFKGEKTVWTVFNYFHVALTHSPRLYYYLEGEGRATGEGTLWCVVMESL